MGIRTIFCANPVTPYFLSHSPVHEDGTRSFCVPGHQYNSIYRLWIVLLPSLRSWAIASVRYGDRQGPWRWGGIQSTRMGDWPPASSRKAHPNSDERRLQRQGVGTLQSYHARTSEVLRSKQKACMHSRFGHLHSNPCPHHWPCGRSQPSIQVCSSCWAIDSDFC